MDLLSKNKSGSSENKNENESTNNEGGPVGRLRSVPDLRQ